METDGYLVSISSTIEEPFLEAGQATPSLVILDDSAVAPDNLWETREVLHWFHLRCPVLLLTNEHSSELEEECDYCFPRTVERDRLLSCVREISG